MGRLGRLRARQEGPGKGVRQCLALRGMAVRCWAKGMSGAGMSSPGCGQVGMSGQAGRRHACVCRMWGGLPHAMDYLLHSCTCTQRTVNSGHP